MGATYFLTGALGCIGAWVVKAIAERGDRAVVFDLDTDARRIRDVLDEEHLAGVRFLHGDLTDQEQVTRALEASGARSVIHLAGLQVPACRAAPAQGARVNVVGTLHLFEAALACGVQRVVYASSAAVYGPAGEDDRAPDESASCEPVTHYGVFKRANEGNARVYWLERGLASAGLRPLTVYGVGRDQGLTSGPTSAMKAAVLGRSFHIGFSGATDFHYVADTAAAFLAAADGAPPGAQLYNLHGETLAVERIVAAIEAEEPAARGRITWGGPPIPIPPALDGRSFRRAFPDLPGTPLAQGIRSTMERFRELARAGRLDLRDLPGRDPGLLDESRAP